MNRLLSTFRSLKYKNFRLFFPGLIISQTGIWLQNIALGWLVYSMTKSPFVMGAIMFANSLPLFLGTPFAGVIIDKFSRHKLLIIIQILFALQSFLLALVTLTGSERIWNIVLLGIFLNVIAAVDVPLRQSVFIYLVDDKKDLGNALSLNSTCFNLARLTGPALAGIVIAKVGEGLCFLFNFLCFIPSLILVCFMNFKEEKSEHVRNETVFEGLKEGFSYIRHKPEILILLYFLFIFSFFGMTYPMLLPVFTKEALSMNADVLGSLMASAGLGALTSSVLIASKTTFRGYKYMCSSGLLLFAAGFIAVGFSPSFLSAFISMYFLGAGMTLGITSLNTLIQTVIEDEKRGRVMSIHALFYMGPSCFGNLLAGSVAEHAGIRALIVGFGVIMFLYGVYFLSRFKKINFNSVL